MKDQFILMYVKDGTVYPVALSKYQLAVFETMLQVMSAEKPIAVVTNRPQGQAEFLKVGKKERKCDTCKFEHWDLDCPPVKDCEVVKGIGVTECPKYKEK